MAQFLRLYTLVFMFSSASVDDDEYLQQTLFLCSFFTKLSTFSFAFIAHKVDYVKKEDSLSHHNIQNTYFSEKVELVHNFFPN